MADDPKQELARVAEPAVTERRGDSRHPFVAAAELQELGSRTQWVARSSDLSRRGCYLDTINPLTLGTVMKLRLMKDGKTFEAQATVVRAQPGMGMHVMFTAAEPEQLWTLETWLGELKESQPAAERVEQSEQARPLKEQQPEVLNELIVALVRKGVLTEAEGKAMIRKLVG